MSGDTDPKISTNCAHAGEEDVPSVSTPAVMPIYQTSVYNFTDLEQVDDVSEAKKPGFIYGRYGLPNLTAVENITAKLEQAESAVATASGMAAIAVAVMVLAESGDEIIVANDSYGGTLALAARDFPRFGITSRFVPTTSLQKIESSFSSKTKVLVVETLSNPLWNVVDVGSVSELCRRKGVRLLVDNTVATPYLIRPLTMGANVVIHSATKFLGGHHDVTAGIVTADGESIARARDIAIRMGMTLGPFDAWLTIRGIKTFALRMERICSNALAVAKFLDKHARVSRVYYPGLESHPQHEIVRRTMRGLGGGMVSFELKGSSSTAGNFVRNLKLIRFAPSLGGVTTTISHPAKTSHRSLTPAQRAEAGVSDNLLRLSIGIEEPADLTDELDRASQTI
jgi:cystathionine beta-lyase/cystathionine gamma-synthase